MILDGNLYVGVPEHDRDSWLILKFGRVEEAGIIGDYTAAGDVISRSMEEARRSER